MYFVDRCDKARFLLISDKLLMYKYSEGLVYEVKEDGKGSDETCEEMREMEGQR